MICPPCRAATDAIAAALADGTITEPTGHDAAVCRDHGRRIRACGCQHRPVQPKGNR